MQARIAVTELTELKVLPKRHREFIKSIVKIMHNLM